MPDATATNEIPFVGRDAVLAAITPRVAIERVRAAFLRHQSGDWRMPAKVYLDSPPYGDFRAMPAMGDDLALLKWITSFPGNAQHGLPAVMGIVCLSDARTGRPLMLLDAGSVTALRTGAVAAIASQALADPDGSSVAVIGCGFNGAWVARCLSAAGYEDGVCVDPRQEVAEALAAELGWRAGTVGEGLACDIVCCVTPGHEIIVDSASLRPGLHLNMLGADAADKAEATVEAVAACALFCDQWEQASHGGELSGAVQAGLVVRDQVTDLGAVLAGTAAGRPGPEAITMFDSTGLAIQDLAIAAAVLQAWRAGSVQTATIEL